MYAEYKRRLAERETYKRETGRELDDRHFPRITVVFDGRTMRKKPLIGSIPARNAGTIVAALCAMPREWGAQRWGLASGCWYGRRW